MSLVGKVYRKLDRNFQKILKRFSFGWYYVTIKQLRFRFNALKHGISENQKTENKLFDLRRNVHRIEKGLSYDIQKKSFAGDYIIETVGLLQESKNLHNIDQSTIEWAISVLGTYFDTVDRSDVRIEKAFAQYNTIPKDKKIYSYYPYPISDRHESSVTYDDLMDLSLKRRSVRYYKDTKISKDIIMKVFDVAKLSPSACNRQSFRFLFYNDKAIVDQLSKIPGGVSGYDLYNVVIVVGDHAGYFDVRDVNAPLIDASLASMSFLYAAETQGLGTVCINWPNIPAKEIEIRKVVELKKSEFVVMMIGLGYPSDKGKIPYSKKRDNQDFLLINERIR